MGKGLSVARKFSFSGNNFCVFFQVNSCVYYLLFIVYLYKLVHYSNKQKMVVIKIQNKTDIRRITVDIVPKYEELLSLARNLFGSSLPSQFVLKYTDEDGK